ncbi:MAG: 3-oxoacyl-ACP reductase family protein [Polyangia bacterium]
MIEESLAGRVALVTGGSRGIGAAISRRLASLGADVALTWIEHGQAAERVVSEIRAAGRRGLALRSDAGDWRAARAAVNEVAESLGRLDILVLNAGITRDSISWQASEADWDRVLAVNLKGAAASAAAAAPIMREQGGGRIVAVASINAERGKPGQASYAASKAGLVALIRTLTRELGPRGITANAVEPGLIETELTAGLPDEIRRRALAETALGRLGEPEDVAAAVAFLAGDGARHITGQVLRVDGGQLIG